MTNKLVYYIAIAAIILTIDKAANAQIVYAPYHPYITGYDTICLLDLIGERIIDFNANPDSGLYAAKDSTTQLTPPIIIQHQDSLLIEKDKLPSKVTFQWYDKYADAIPNADSSYFLPTITGYYYATITDSSGNVSEPSKMLRFVLTDFSPLNSTDDIQISESNNLLNIKFINEPYFGYQLFIYNSIGQKVFSSEINFTNTIANLAPLAKGLYLVAVEKGNKRIVKKIIID